MSKQRFQTIHLVSDFYKDQRWFQKAYHSSHVEDVYKVVKHNVAAPANYVSTTWENIGSLSVSYKSCCQI